MRSFKNGPNPLSPSQNVTVLLTPSQVSVEPEIPSTQELSGSATPLITLRIGVPFSSNAFLPSHFAVQIGLEISPPRPLAVFVEDDTVVVAVKGDITVHHGQSPVAIGRTAVCSCRLSWNK